MVVINLCQCVFPGVHASKEDHVDVEEAVALLKKSEGPLAEMAGMKSAAKKDAAKEGKEPDLMTDCNRSLDIFKGVLVIFMTMAHVDLTLMNPGLQYFDEIPHFVGNAASGLCFLGFMTAYGFSCDNAYLSDWKKRTLAQRLERLARSALMPVFGAWACAFGWGYMCWKLPFDFTGVIQILDFRIALGNGPDFLLCFTTCLLAMYPLRGLVNNGLSAESWWARASTVALMLLGPLVLTFCVVPDCTGMKKYLGYILACHLREPYSPVLPGLPHLFYFNMGVLLSRYMKGIAADTKAGAEIDKKRMAAMCLCIAALLLVLAYPLMTVWNYNYGNLAAQTKWGPIIRGFVDGPTILWLVGNLFPIYVLMGTTLAIHKAVEPRQGLLWWPLRFILGELEHYGGNVLLYLVVGDVCLAGLWRGMQNSYPLDTVQCWWMTVGIMIGVRFVHYLGASSRDAKGMAGSGGVSAG